MGTAAPALVALLLGRLLAAQAPATDEKNTPVVVAFVAPAYPKAARDQRIQGVTLTEVFINPEGVVTEAKTIQAHPVFEEYVLEALKQWRFRPSEQARTLQITCRFELLPECAESSKRPIASETYVSAELPTVVHIKAGLACIQRSVARQQH